MKYIHSKVCRLRLLSAVLFLFFFFIQIKAQHPVRPDTTQTVDQTGFTHVTFHQATDADSEKMMAPQALEVETITVRGVSFNMIRVKGGTFTMGATEEQGGYAQENEFPATEQTVDDYWIGETEVTQELWEAVMGYNPSFFKGPQLPVECIRYVDCESFFFKLNFFSKHKFRLPTEAEWEYAARGGNKALVTVFSGGENLDSVAWFCNNSGNVTHDVKTKAPNELGIYDMSGNVDEWCVDAYHFYGQTAPSEATDRIIRVKRGGGFLDFPAHLRVSDRRGSSELMWNKDVGLRLAE